MIALSTEQGFVWVGFDAVLLGWVQTEQGQQGEGITQMRQGLTMLQTAGAYNQVSQLLALLAEVYGKAGRADEGLMVVAEAFALVEKIGERFYEAELYRLKGTLTLKQSGVRSP